MLNLKVITREFLNSRNLMIIEALDIYIFLKIIIVNENKNFIGITFKIMSLIF